MDALSALVGFGIGTLLVAGIWYFNTVGCFGGDCGDEAEDDEAEE